MEARLVPDIEALYEVDDAFYCMFGNRARLFVREAAHVWQQKDVMSIFMSMSSKGSISNAYNLALAVSWSFKLVVRRRRLTVVIPFWGYLRLIKLFRVKVITIISPNWEDVFNLVTVNT